MGSKNNWNADAMKGTLISEMENEVLEGIRKTNADGRGGEKHQPSAISPQPSNISPQPSDISHQTSSLSPQPSDISPQTSSLSPQPSEKEPTKGVQTYIPMSMYRRLNDIKLTRRENIAALVAQAIELWLDVQEGQNSNSVTL